MIKTMIKAATFGLVGALISLPALAGQEMKVGVKGMVCSFCAQGIEKKFRSQDEVADIQVSLEKKFVMLKFNDGKTLSEAKITQLLKDAGYEANFSSGESAKP
jgi:periplasmic mercuric ion binding protein